MDMRERIARLWWFLKDIGKMDRDYLRTLTWRQRWTIWRSTQRFRWAFARGYIRGAIDAARTKETV